MKSLRLFGAVLLFLAASTQAASVINSFTEVPFWVGSGSQQAVLILDWEDGKHLQGDTAPAERSIAWGFRWDGSKTGIEMLHAIDAADPRLHLEFKTFEGFGEYLSAAYYDLDGDGGISFDGTVTDSGDHFRDDFDGYWRYFVKDATDGNSPAWSQGDEAQVGASTRMLANGSWDAWVYTDYAYYPDPGPVPPSAVAAVPEPSAVWTLTLALACSTALIRRR